jgi:hypothetical protein
MILLPHLALQILAARGRGQNVERDKIFSSKKY